jgi:signal transduction histidine kinase
MCERLRKGGSITRQVALIVLGSLFLAHVLSAVVWMRYAPLPPSIQLLASRIELTTRIARATARGERAALVAAASEPNLPVRLVDALPENMGATDWRGARLLREALNSARPPLPVVFGPAPGGETGRSSAAVAVTDDTWLLFIIPEHVGPFGRLAWFAPLTDLLFGALPLALVSIWAARRVTGPLVRLARAAEQVAATDDPLPLPEAGTREIRQVAHALNALIDQLRRFVADRTRMLAAISHDLRTPLTRLRLRAEGIPDAVAREKMLQDILRMDAMISSTLAFIREDARQEAMAPVDIGVLLVTVCDAFADSGADVSYVGPLHCAGVCRPQAMERALNNLIDNAVKFGGAATVTLLDAPGRDLAIDVEDEGPGVPASQREEVFKPFTRGDVARGIDGGGVGLGLSITRTIIQDHGGAIELRDRAPRGLLVRVTLPRTMRPTMRDRREPEGLATVA